LERISKLWRILRIFTLIEGGSGVSARDLAEKCEVSVRTIYRDVDLLKLAGIPIYFDKGYRVPEGFFLPAVQFGLQEVLSMIMGAQLLAHQKGSPLAKGMASAMEKVYAVLPPGLRETAVRESHRFTPAPEPRVDYRAQSAVLETLAACCEEKHCVLLEYHSLARDEVTEREVDPYGFLYRSNALYLVGQCHLRSQIKIFKVDRIHSAASLPESFQLPEEFDLGEYMRDAWGVVRGEPHEVSIRFAPSIAHFVKESIWHSSQTCTDNPDGSAVLHFKVGGLMEIAAWLMGFGGEAEVLEPAELRAMLLEQARAITDLYV
jgi:predicted DNA-binding transcriptional regulator YafY